jgi:hypothetical protein
VKAAAVLAVVIFVPGCFVYSQIVGEAPPSDGIESYVYWPEEDALVFTEYEAGTGRLRLVELASGANVILVEVREQRIDRLTWWTERELAFSATRSHEGGGFESAIWIYGLDNETAWRETAWMPQIEDFVRLPDGRVLLARAPTFTNYLRRSEYESGRVELTILGKDGEKLTGLQFAHARSMNVLADGSVLMQVFRLAQRDIPADRLPFLQWRPDHSSYPLSKDSIKSAGDTAVDPCILEETLAFTAFSKGPSKYRAVRMDPDWQLRDSWPIPEHAGRVCASGDKIFFLAELDGTVRYREIWWMNVQTGRSEPIHVMGSAT